MSDAFKRKFITPVAKLVRNDTFILGVIVLNAVVIFFQVSNYTWTWLTVIDIACTLIFLLEMFSKQHHYGFRRYWQQGWNRFDGILVIISLPSLLAPFLNTDVELLGFHVSLAQSAGTLLVLRLLRVIRFFRLLRFFPNFAQIVKGFRLAMKQSWAVLAAFALLVLIFGLVNCSLFANVAPQYFDTPLRSIYSMFRICTVEGWYEIPDAIASVTSPTFAHVVRLYFSVLLIAGGIIGMSFINSVFVDAMAEDNNDEVKQQLDRIEKRLDELFPKK